MLKVQVTKPLGSVKSHSENRLFHRVIEEQRKRHGTLLSYLPKLMEETPTITSSGRSALYHTASVLRRGGSVKAFFSFFQG